MKELTRLEHFFFDSAEARSYLHNASGTGDAVTFDAARDNQAKSTSDVKLDIFKWNDEEHYTYIGYDGPNMNEALEFMAGSIDALQKKPDDSEEA